MPVCDICCQELASESDMKTHLLLSHFENEMSCPFCSLSGVSYDELNFHISTAHTEVDFECTPTAGQTLSSDQAPVPSRKDDAKWTVDNSTDLCHSWRTSASPHTSRYHTNGTAAPSAGITLSQGQGALSRTKSSPPAATTRIASKKRTGSVKAPSIHPEQTEENAAEHCKSKQKHMSSPKKERMFSCPFCSLVCSDCFLLQEHVELHLQVQAVSAYEGAVPEAGSSAHACSSTRNEGLQLYECPLCSVICLDNSSLQEHVELHLDNNMDTAAGDLSGDLRFARQLQEEEEEKRKVEEAKQEKEDFKKLQKVFGLDNSGGYRRQMEQNMEQAVSRGQMGPVEFHQKRAELIESLASGVDDGRSRTTGVLEALHAFYQHEARGSTRVWLCAETDHYSSSDGDKGWGCGYRNFQMLLSALQRMDEYTTLHTLPDSIPSIPRVQALIEAAWAEGIDPQGASHFSGKLQGTRAWVGATEIYSVLTAHRVRARIVDFHQPTGPSNTHPRLFEWVKNYFSHHSSRGTRLPPRVVMTNLPPIYLQHQGHSRTIVGMEERKNGSQCVLLLDPGCSPGQMNKLLNSDTTTASISRMRKFPGHLKHTQYQVVVAEGVLTREEKQQQILNSRILNAERIP